MRDELAGLEQILDLTTADFDLFNRCIRALLSHCYLIRGVDDELYTFALRNYSLLEPYFQCMGAILRKDESLGVIAWKGGHESQVRLNQEETCAILVFRLFFEELRNNLRLSEFPTITLFDFLERYQAIVNDSLRKTRLIELLRHFSNLKLIAAPQGADPDGQIVLYPSIAFVLDQEGIDEILQYIKTRESREVSS